MCSILCFGCLCTTSFYSTRHRDPRWGVTIDFFDSKHLIFSITVKKIDTNINGNTFLIRHFLLRNVSSFRFR